MIKDKTIVYVDLAWMDDPIKSDKWRNIIFDKAGKSYFGRKLYNSENSAYQRIVEIIDRGNRGLNDGIDTLNGIILWPEYSHTIQMPVKE